MKQNEKISNIMTKEVRTIHLKTPLSEVRQIFKEINGQHLPVLNGKKLIGMLSYTDLMSIESGTLYSQDPKYADILIDNLSDVQETMTKNLETIRPDSTVKEATKILSNRNFHSLPVTSEDGHLEGLITSTDLLKYFSNSY